MSARVTVAPAVGEVMRVRQAARMTSSVRGPQKAVKIRRKIPTRLSTTTSAWARSPSRTLSRGGAAWSPGSRTTVRPSAVSGRRARMSRTRSPLGSMTRAPRPASASARTMVAMRVDLPEPVAPMMCRWCRPSATARPTGRSVARSERPSGLAAGPGRGTAAMGRMERAPARWTPGAAVSNGRWAIAASSGTDSRSPRIGKWRSVIRRAGSLSRWRAYQLRPEWMAKAEATACARPRSRSAVSAWSGMATE